MILVYSIIPFEFGFVEIFPANEQRYFSVTKVFVYTGFRPSVLLIKMGWLLDSKLLKYSNVSYFSEHKFQLIFV